jgi:hypothetical protein
MKPEDVQKVLDGARVRILRFGSSDAWFNPSNDAERYSFVGREGVFLQDDYTRGYLRPPFFQGDFLFLDDNEVHCFHQIKVELV